MPIYIVREGWNAGMGVTGDIPKTAMTMKAHVVLKRKHLETPVGFNGGVQRDKHAPHIRIQDPILVPVIHKSMYDAV